MLGHSKIGSLLKLRIYVHVRSVISGVPCSKGVSFCLVIASGLFIMVEFDFACGDNGMNM